MKRFTVGMLLIITACVSGKYTELSKEVVSKSVYIEVPTVVKQTWLTYDGKKFSVHEETAPTVIEGAGVIISSKGHILTCDHLFNVGVSTSIYVTLPNGIRLPALMVYQDKNKDLALIKINGQYRPAFISYFPLQMGDEVLAVGSPCGLAFTITKGIVSCLNRDLGEPEGFTQIDTPINPGNSGGPLFNMRGEIVGIVARKIPHTDGLGFAITQATIREFLSVFKGIDNDN